MGRIIDSILQPKAGLVIEDLVLMAEIMLIAGLSDLQKNQPGDLSVQDVVDLGIWASQQLAGGAVGLETAGRLARLVAACNGDAPAVRQIAASLAKRFSNPTIP